MRRAAEAEPNGRLELVWIQERVAVLQKVLERRTERSTLLLRALLRKIRLEPVAIERGRLTTERFRTCRSWPYSTSDRRRRAGPRFYFFAMVEAAGVEPASEGVTGKATPCSAS